MTLYTVLAPPESADDSPPDPLGFVLIKDGFCWPALFVPELWLIFRRMWLILALYVAVGLALIIAAEEIGGILPVLVILLARFLFAIEANGLRRWTLEGSGFRLVDVVEAANQADADARFFGDGRLSAVLLPDGPPSPPTAVLPSQPAPEPPALPPSNSSTETGEVIGLFPAPGGRS